jgi:EAL domain-containing protein (putative c-di-GMP-specific phosphodiesterase class I)
MDDFGSGTSSLSCLADYPFDIIKIDRQLLEGVSAAGESQLVVRAAITLIANLGRRSVAEGIETLEQLALCQVLGCDYAQGYLLGKPLPEARVLSSADDREPVEALQRLA